MSDTWKAAAGPRGAEERNPGFGAGALRRRIRLVAAPGAVRAGIEDAYHSFRLVLRHDGARILALEPGFRRVPLTTCPGAGAPLQRFIGTALDTPGAELVAREDPRGHCTHLHDLTILAMAHARRGGARQYDVAVPDEADGPVWSTLHRDGVEVLRWRTLDARIVEPGPLEGRPLLRGFARWATATFDGDALEAAFVLHKGYFVSRARPWNVEASAGRPVAHHTIMRGACFSYSEPQMSVAIRNTGTSIDTSDAATPLLADFDREGDGA